MRGEKKKFFLFPPKPAAAVGVSVMPLSFAERDGTAGFLGSLNGGLLEMVEEKTFIGIDFSPLLLLCMLISLCLEMFLRLLCVSKALITSDEPMLALFPCGSFDTIVLFEKEANILLS